MSVMPSRKAWTGGRVLFQARLPGLNNHTDYSNDLYFESADFVNGTEHH